MSTNYENNATLSRTPKQAVYTQITTDLLAAEQALTEIYLKSNPYGIAEKVRPNRSAAQALLARVYLYTSEWSKAEEFATKIINKTEYFQLSNDLDMVFLANSSEAIWQLQPITPGYNTFEGSSFIVVGDAPTRNIMRKEFAESFEEGDKRSSKWIGRFALGLGTGYFPHKYKIDQSGVLSEYSMVLRLAEQFLIRSEARIRIGKIADGIDDLNKLRSFRRDVPSANIFDPLPELNANVGEQEAFLLLEKERKAELFCEWGHRWFDLKRWPSLTSASLTRADDVMPTFKGSAWQSTDIKYPIPQQELDRNQNLKPQNVGY